MGCALDVNRISLIAKVLGPSVSLKEVAFEVIETATKMALKGLVSRTFNIAFEAIEIVTRVKVVDPHVLRRLTITPGAVGRLQGATGLSSSAQLHGDLENNEQT